jgi:hypothetical protein
MKVKGELEYVVGGGRRTAGAGQVAGGWWRAADR